MVANRLKWCKNATITGELPGAVLGLCCESDLGAKPSLQHASWICSPRELATNPSFKVSRRILCRCCQLDGQANSQSFWEIRQYRRGYTSSLILILGRRYFVLRAISHYQQVDWDKVMSINLDDIDVLHNVPKQQLHELKSPYQILVAAGGQLDLAARSLTQGSIRPRSWMGFGIYFR